MQATKRFGLLTLAGSLIIASAVTAWVQTPQSPLPALPQAPSAAWDVLYAQPFVLDEGYTHYWRLEQPTVYAGYIVVLEVNPDHVVPRQTYEPVLYVGSQTAERVNHGHLDGRLVVIVPTVTDADGMPVLDLEETPVWFGEPELPERVDAAWIADELAQATAAGVQPAAQARVQAALQAGGGLLALSDRVELDGFVVDIIERFAPSEVDLISGMRAPQVK